VLHEVVKGVGTEVVDVGVEESTAVDLGDLFDERELDVQVTKNFKLFSDASGYVRMDVLNVFNTPYYDPAAAVFSPVGGQSYPPPQFNQTGPILGVPFTVKLTVGVKW